MWFVAAPGIFDTAGTGDLSFENLQTIHADLRDRVFVSLSAPKELRRYVGTQNKWAIFRVRLNRYERLPSQVRPKVATVAKGAQVAVLPGIGPVWVDGHRLFHEGETVPLPWTDPLVSLVVVRPRTVVKAMRKAIGPNGPKRIPEFSS